MEKLFFVQANELSKRGNAFHINLDIDIPKMQLDENDSIVLTPVLTEGEHIHELPHILINGKMRHKGYKQMVRYVGEAVVSSTYKVYKAFKARRFSNRICYYDVNITYENWMSNAKIQLKSMDKIPNEQIYVSMG